MKKSDLLLRSIQACFSVTAITAAFFLPHSAHAGVVGVPTQQAGATPFIESLNATYSGGTLQSVGYSIQPKPGSLTRPFAITYPASYLATVGGITSTSVAFSVFGLYANFSNSVNLTFTFTDGTTATQSIVVTTAAYTDPCTALNSPTFTQSRTSTGQLNFDYFLMKDLCSSNDPAIVDTDGNFRWVGTAGDNTPASILYNNGIYFSNGTGISRIELTTGAVTPIGNYATSNNVTSTGHHNIDPGRNGLILDVNTTTETESVNLEIDANTGEVLNLWDMGQIISAAMTAGGDNPALFDLDLTTPSTDWFHNNATAYNAVDNTLIVSSRENFVIAVDYDTPADGQKKIHWILGDETKAWYQFKSLAKYALTLAPGTNVEPPIGQHAVSIDHLGNVLVFDDGAPSTAQSPAGVTLPNSSVQEYIINTKTMTATGGFSWSPSPAVFNAYCGSVYDVNGTYLVDMPDLANGSLVEFWGVGTSSNTVFNLTYPGTQCAVWNSSLLQAPVASFAPSFTLTPASTTLSVAIGASGTDVISLNSAFGFDTAVSFVVSGLPTGATGSVSPASSLTGTTLSVSTTSAASAGYYPVTITGTSGTVSATATVTLLLTAPVSTAQTITFGTIATQQSGTTLSLTATASSGLAVTYASSTPAVCTVSSATATLLAAGTCTITASQSGSGNYAAATPVMQSFTINAPATSPGTSPAVTGINLASLDNVYALANANTAPAGGGLDGYGNSLPANLLGNAVTWSGNAFMLGSATTQNGIAAKTITLPAGNYASLQFLATGVNNPSTNQVFTVTYTDGTTSTLTQSISDWGNPQSYTGESIAATALYRVLANGTTQKGPWYVFGYSFALNSAKTVQSFTLPNTKSVVVLAVDLLGPAPAVTTTGVSLSSVDNVNAIASSGAAPANGGLDSSSYAYAANLLSTTVMWSGSTFALGTATAPSAVAAKTITLPAGKYSSLKMLASSAYGPLVNQTFTVTYTDGTTSTFTQTLSDWGFAQSFPGESIAVSTSYRVTPTGTTAAGPWYIYGYSFALNNAKTVQSLTLPNTRQVVVFALDLIAPGAAPAAPTPVSLSSVDNVNAIANSGTAPVNGGVDTSSYAYASNLLGTSATWSGITFNLGTAAGTSAVAAKTIPLPAGSYSSLKMLASAVHGPLTNQTFTVTYTDGTTTSFTQSLSDWGYLQSFAGESVAVTTSYRVTPTGTTATGTWDLYGYSFTLNPAKTVQSFTLPNSRQVVVFAVDLAP